MHEYTAVRCRNIIKNLLYYLYSGNMSLVRKENKALNRFSEILIDQSAALFCNGIFTSGNKFELKKIDNLL